MRNVARIQHHTLCLAGSARRIDDRDHIIFLDRQRNIGKRSARCTKRLTQGKMRRSLRPLLDDCIRHHLIATTNQRGRTILHHRDQFPGRLPRIQRDHRQPLSHNGQIHRHPLNRVVRQKRAPVALPEPQPPQISAPDHNLVKQLSGSNRYQAPVAQLLEHNVIAALLQARENLFEKIHLFRNCHPERSEGPAFFALPTNCHPERSNWFAKRSSYAVEGPLLTLTHRAAARRSLALRANYEYAPTNSRSPPLIGGK